MCAVMDLLTCFHIQVWGFVRGIRILHKNVRIHRCRMHPPSDLSGFDHCVRANHSFWRRAFAYSLRNGCECAGCCAGSETHFLRVAQKHQIPANSQHLRPVPPSTTVASLPMSFTHAATKWQAKNWRGVKSGLGDLLAKSLAAAIQNMHYLFYITNISQLRLRWLCGMDAPVCNQPFSVLPKFVDTGHQTQRQTIASCKTSIFYLSMLANVASHTLWGSMTNKNLVLSKRGGNNSRN